jgi:hypothetical protein
LLAPFPGRLRGGLAGGSAAARARSTRRQIAGDIESFSSWPFAQSAIAAEAREAIDDMYEAEKASKLGLIDRIERA